MIKWFLSSICSFIILVACTQQEKTPDMAEGEILFNVDSTLIQAAHSFNGFGFQIRPPRSWQATSPEMFEKIKEILESYVQTTDDFKINPMQFFLNPENQSILVVSNIISQGIEMTPPALKEEYITAIRTSFALYNPQENRFVKTKIPIVQYLLQKEEHIIFKLLFEDAKNQLIQLDYIVPQSIFTEEAKAIESSIGTIRVQ